MRMTTAILALQSATGTVALTATTTTAPPRINRMASNMRRLGRSDLVVSEACLGTMTWGNQNTEEEAHAQIDMARSRGINFLDTAELYPVPMTAPTWRAGATEEIIGNYLTKMGPAVRDDMVIATKIAGYAPRSRIAAAREAALGGGGGDGPLPDCRHDAASVRKACDASLARLKTDRIDLYQIHWPDRYVPLWGQADYRRERQRDDRVDIRETAAAFRDLIEAGKVRAIGLSNESTYGLCEWVRSCEDLGIADKLATVQNSYSLIDRRFDTELAEACDHYDVGLLPWSVLAGGLLSGKYMPNAAVRPADSKSRFVAYPDYMIRWSPKSASARTLAAVEEYARIAERAGLTPSQLAIEFARTRAHVAANGSTIIGATTIEQLDENIGVFEGEGAALDEDTLAAIEEVHHKNPNPSCLL